MRRIHFLCMVALFLFARSAFAQNSFLSSWEARVRATSKQQPGWSVPVFTASSGLVQLARADFIRQYTPTLTTTWNYGGSKGFSLIPWYKTEVDVNLPPYLQHNTPKVLDGAGDFSLQLKYRIASSNVPKGGYAISASLAGTAPTGSYKNGAADGTISPNIFLGKGWRCFDVQTSASESLPTGHTSTLGRPISWNAVVQEQAAKIFWPEIEFNSTFYRGGPHDGMTQSFVTPGLMISKIKFGSSLNDRLAVVFGAGEQIAMTQYHAYNHGLSLSTRISF